jgi:hypothetical protein
MLTGHGLPSAIAEEDDPEPPLMILIRCSNKDSTWNLFAVVPPLFGHRNLIGDGILRWRTAATYGILLRTIIWCTKELRRCTSSP